MVIVSMTLAFLFMLIRKLITKLRILYRCYKFSKTIKGPNTAELKVNKTSDRLLKWLKSCRQQYGKIFCVWSGTEFAVVITDREDVEMVISNEDIPKKSSIFKNVPNWIGQGLSHDDWGKVRKLSTTEFSFSQIVENNCQTLISNIEDHGYKSPFDIAPIFSKYSLNICCEIALGVKKNSDFVGILRNLFESSEVQGSFMTHEGRKIKAAFMSIDSADPIGYSDFKGGLKIWNRQFELRALTSILRNFEVLPVDNFEPEIVFDGTIKSRHGIQVCLKKRVI